MFRSVPSAFIFASLILLIGCSPPDDQSNNGPDKNNSSKKTNTPQSKNGTSDKQSAEKKTDESGKQSESSNKGPSSTDPLALVGGEQWIGVNN